MGDRKIEIVDKCGEPLSRDIVCVETHFTDELIKRKSALEEWKIGRASCRERV